MVTILRAADIETLMRTAVVGQKGMIEHVVATVVSFTSSRVLGSC